MKIFLKPEQNTVDCLMRRALDAGVSAEDMSYQKQVAEYYAKAKYFTLDQEGERFVSKLEESCMEEIVAKRATTSQAAKFKKLVIDHAIKLHVCVEIDHGRATRIEHRIPAEYVVYAWRYLVEEMGMAKFAPKFEKSRGKSEEMEV